MEHKKSKMALKEGILFITLLLSGSFGGIGFFTLVGNNPALQKMTHYAFVEYWQNLDHYMGARMPIFGPILIIAVLASIVVLYSNYSKVSFFLMLAAFVFLATDLAIAVKINDPLNLLIQSWNLQQLPQNVEEVKYQVISAFYWRTISMLGCFVFCFEFLEASVRSF